MFSDGVAPKRRGAQENFPPPPLDGPAVCHCKTLRDVKVKVQGRNRRTANLPLVIVRPWFNTSTKFGSAI